MLTRLCNLEPVILYFCMVKLLVTVYTPVHCFSYFLALNIDCGFSLELSQGSGSKEYPQSMLGAKTITIFHLKIVIFTVLKIAVYCIGKNHVNVMKHMAIYL